MINYILVHRKNKEMKAPTFRRMNEVECLFHSTPQVTLSDLTAIIRSLNDVNNVRDIINVSEAGLQTV